MPSVHAQQSSEHPHQLDPADPTSPVGRLTDWEHSMFSGQFSREHLSKNPGLDSTADDRATIHHLNAPDRLQLPSWETALWRGNEPQRGDEPERGDDSPPVAVCLSKEALRMQQRALNLEHQQAKAPGLFEKGKPCNLEGLPMRQCIQQAEELLFDVESMVDDPMHKQLTNAALTDVQDLLAKLDECEN